MWWLSGSDASNALPSDESINNIEDVGSALNGVYSGLLSSEYYGADFISRAEVGGEDVQTSTPSKRTEILQIHVSSE